MSASSTQTSQGPDLGSFIAAVDESTPADLSSNMSVDLPSPPRSQSAPDLASVSHDMATLPSTTIDMTTPGPCGAVTYAGTCSGNTLTYCYDNKVTTLKCTGGEQCTTVNGDSDCRFVQGSPCGNVDSNGLCDNDTLVYCQSSQLVVTDCTAQGLDCDTIFGFSDCD